MNNRKGIIGFLFCVVFSLHWLPSEETVHLVRRGETIYSIARSYNVERDELMRLNGITDPSKLQAGQRLKIPGTVEASGGSAGKADAVSSQTASLPTAPLPTASAAGVSVRNGAYEVLRGDTLYGIARRFGVGLDALLKTNSLSSSYMLKQGDVLQIPGFSAVASSQAAANPASPGSSGAKAPVAAAEPASSPQKAVPEPSVEEKRAAALSMRWPVNAREVDYMTGKLPGVAITGERTEAVKSLTWGTVISAGPYRGFGRIAIVQAEGGYLYVYGGCESLSVQEGDKVGPGTELGRLGIDTVSEKPRLFFVVYRSNTPIDPAKAPRA